MTQNLRLAPGKTIYNTDSDISAASYALPSDTTTFTSYTAANAHAPNSADLDNTGFTSKDITADQIGVWYNYCAATAGTVCTNSSTTGPDPAPADICPKGWRLPTQNEQEALRTSTDAVSKFSPALGGNYYGGSLRNAGSYGIWWSATAGPVSAGGRYDMDFNGSRLYVGSNVRYSGFSVRCVQSAD